MITQQDITSLCQIATNLGYGVQPNQLELIVWNAGIDTHVPRPLPMGMSAVYIFQWQQHCLKVGKADVNSNARYQSQHYSVNGNGSTLARSIQNEPEFQALAGIIPGANIGGWIRGNTNRYNLLMSGALGPKFLNFAEAYFILKNNPIFER